MEELKIVEYETKHVKQISEIIIRNLLEVESKKYGMEKVKEMAEGVKTEILEKTLSKRKKVYVALIDDEVIGSTGIEELGDTKDETYIFTSFVKPERHGQNIEKALIEKIEEDAKKLSIKKLVTPVTKETHEFFYELGYRDSSIQQQFGEDSMHLMEKTF